MYPPNRNRQKSRGAAMVANAQGATPGSTAKKTSIAGVATRLLQKTAMPPFAPHTTPKPKRPSTTDEKAPLLNNMLEMDTSPEEDIKVFARSRKFNPLSTYKRKLEPASAEQPPKKRPTPPKATPTIRSPPVSVAKNNSIAGFFNGFRSLPNAFYGASRAFPRQPLYRPPPINGTGFSNLGNTCYMNVILQVILSVPSFTQQLLNEPLIARTLPHSVLEALSDCAAAYKSGQRAVAPVKVKKAMGAKSEAFRGYMQQDAHEFFCNLLDAVSTEVESEEAKPLREPVTGDAVKDPGSEAFAFTVQHKLTCSKCGTNSCVEEVFNHLSIELPEEDTDTVKAENVGSMLERYFQDEQVEKQCEHCSDKVDVPHTVSHKIKRLPRVLALHIKRFLPVFENNTFSFVKLNGRLTINQAIRLKQFCTEGVSMNGDSTTGALLSEKENDAAASQRFQKDLDDKAVVQKHGGVVTAIGKLHAVINHHGSEPTSGHYTVDINKGGKWTRFNDSRTENISVGQAIDDSRQRACYMLFYNLSDK